MAELFLTAVNALYARNNITTAVPPMPAVQAAFEHVRATGISRVAEQDGRIVGIGGAVVRDNLWYLSSFWVHPDLQRRGIGKPLLNAVWEAGREAGARTFFVWSSIDTTALAAYMKLGMLPGYQILVMEGAPTLPLPLPGYEVETLDGSTALELDLAIRGTRRAPDHDLWLATPGQQARQVRHRGRIAGYFYCNRGKIGPAAWAEPQDAEAVLTLACHEAATAAPQVSFAVPGINGAALRFAFAAGLRLTSCAHFLTTKPFGRMEQYLPSGPSLY